MMRVILLISSVFLTTAKECALDASGAVANSIDSALGIWASTERCQPPMLSNAPIKCEQDVASTIKSVSATASAIAGMLNSCGEIDETNEKCGLAVNALVGATAGLAAASGEIADQCALHSPGAEELHPTSTDLGKCTANSGAAINSVFDAKNTISRLQKTCDDSGDKKCIVDILDVVSVVAELGAHLAGSAAFCESYANNAAGVPQEKCAKGILDAVSSLSGVAKLGLGIQKECSAEATRLYLETRGKAATSSAILPITLAAVLPIAAVLSVIAGLRFAKSRQYSSARVVEENDAEELLEAPVIE